MKLGGTGVLTLSEVELKIRGGSISATATTMEAKDKSLKDLDRLVLGWPG